MSEFNVRSVRPCETVEAKAAAVCRAVPTQVAPRMDIFEISLPLCPGPLLLEATPTTWVRRGFGVCWRWPSTLDAKNHVVVLVDRRNVTLAALLRQRLVTTAPRSNLVGHQRQLRLGRRRRGHLEG